MPARKTESNRSSHSLRAVVGASLAFAALSIAGCFKVVPGETELEFPEPAPSAADGSQPAESSAGDADAAQQPGAPKEAIAVAEEPPREVYEPHVYLSEAHAATCRIRVGDTMPDLVLLDTSGAEQKLSAFAGEKLTIVVFWNSHEPLALEQFQRLAAETADRYSGLGVGVAAVNVGDGAEDVKRLNDEFGGAFACLLDKDESAFQQIATEKLPRTYLLDIQGHVVWFDIEYSRNMRRQLHNAVHYSLENEHRPAEK